MQRLGFDIYSDGEHYNIYCFRTESAAEVFLKAFDGEWITSQQRKKVHLALPMATKSREHAMSAKRYLRPIKETARFLAGSTAGE
ncbi:hypothetical protein C7476_13117 [Phyllobacterium bourgognense]|uniref:Uncharacterized protein n=1 Tax=Phyllobacterium bourgognense TaxID=314236 RepID=A0A368YED9_9HYPH|nr:hypothetical protein C7476_13117 [Phyllobacterium bourgognense]